MKKEYIWAILIAVVVLILANLSFIIPSLSKNDGLIFLKRSPINPNDTYVYISQIEQVKQGRVFTENQFTSEPQKPAIPRLSYFVIGNAARLLHISSVSAYYIFRILFSAILCFAVYKFLFLFFDSSGKRLTAFTLILASSGLGFTLAKFVPLSTDLWMPETVTFLFFTQAPHFILSLTLIIAGYLLFLKYLKVQNIGFLLATWILFFLLSFEQPYLLVAVVPAVFFTGLWSKISLPKSLIAAFFSGAGLALRFDELWNGPILSSPSPLNYISGFGFLLVFGLVGLENLLLKENFQSKLVLVWIGVTTLFLYAPLNFQRQLSLGVQIPLAIAAVYGIYALFGKRKLVIPILIFILCLGSFFAVYRDFKSFADDPKDNPYYYIKPQNLEGIVWLKSQTNFKDIILANRYFGDIIPGLTGRKVYLGHQTQTIDLAGKIDKANVFLLETDNQKAVKFLKDNGITYIYLGVYDSMTAYGFKPEEKEYLNKIYDKEGVTIYKAVHDYYMGDM